MLHREISELPLDPNNCGLYNGLSGDLLFLYKLSTHPFSELELATHELSINEERFQQKLNFIQENMNLYLGDYGISRGLSGVAWFLEYVNQQQGGDYDPDFCSEIDKILLEYLSQEQWLGEIECVLGLGSIAAYAGRRLKRNKSPELYERIVYHYEKLAIEIDEHTLTWSQPEYSAYRFNTENRKEPEFNLGLAHGVPGIIAVLTPALNIPTLRDRVKKLIVNACNWLLQQELDEPERISFFSTSVDNSNPARLGWCYGDLTIATTLLNVGQSIENPVLIDKAREVAIFSADKNVRQAQVVDAGVCHGSAGLAVIFKLLFLQFEEPCLLEASEYWFAYTCELYERKGKEGFYRFSGLSGEYEESFSYLSGYGGIGFAMLAMLGGDIDWTDSLFLS